MLLASCMHTTRIYSIAMNMILLSHAS
jgi:hypothetical protein